MSLPAPIVETPLCQLNWDAMVSEFMPTAGDIKPTVATTAPNGWLLMQGQTLNSFDYPALARAMGATGATFTLPDARGRALIGAGTGTGLTARTLLGTGGTEKLALADVPAHTHNFSGTTGNPSVNLNHNHTIPGVSSYNGQFGASPIPFPTGSSVTGNTDLTHTHTFSGTTDNGTGGAAADSKMQPWLAVNWLVKT